MKGELIGSYCEQLENVPTRVLLKDPTESQFKIVLPKDKEAEVIGHQLPSNNG